MCSGAGRAWAISRAQSDYFQAVKGGGHGDYHLIVLAPSTLTELYSLTMNAFDYADHYRNPVMILMDGILGQMVEPVVVTDPEYRPLDPQLSRITFLTDTRAASRHRGRSHLSQPAEAAWSAGESTAGGQVPLRSGPAGGRCAEETPRQGTRSTVVAWPTGLSTGSRRSRRPSTLRSRRGRAGQASSGRSPMWPFPCARPARGHRLQGQRQVLVVEMSAGQMIEDVRLAVNGAVPVDFLAGSAASPRRSTRDRGKSAIVSRHLRRSSSTNAPRPSIEQANPLLPRAAATGPSTSCSRRPSTSIAIRERTILIAPVGCSVLAYNYLAVDGSEAAHRRPAVATGLKRALPAGSSSPTRATGTCSPSAWARRCTRQTRTRRSP